MAKYKILIKESAIKEFESVPSKSLKQIIKRILSLGANLRPKGFQKLSAQERYRIRQGDYRIIYSVQDDQTTVQVYKIGHRREVYRS